MRFFRQPILVIALLGVAVAVPALAQQASQYPAPCDASKVSHADVERAHTLYLSGKQFLDESNYDKAISYFKDAYSIDCSVHAILPIIATSFERKGDKLEAIRALEEYLKRAPSASDREVVERRIRNLKDQVAATGTPPATSTPQPTATTSASPVTTAAASAPSTSTTVEAPQTGPSTASGGPPSPPGGGHAIAPWALFGVGAAAMITGGVLLVVGTTDVSDADNQCPNRMCPKTDAGNAARSKGNTGRTLETVGGIVGGVGLAAAAGGLIWHFVESSSSGSSGTGGMGGLVSPSIAPGYAGMSFAGRF